MAYIKFGLEKKQVCAWLIQVILGHMFNGTSSDEWKIIWRKSLNENRMLGRREVLHGNIKSDKVRIL